jgi:D-erythro-7,8-dihydroneopterin triphosphate epimerase
MHTKHHDNKPIVARPEATIDVKNLRLRTFIGFNPDELTKKQDVVVNIQIRYVLPPAVLGDSVEDALNYKTVTKEVIALVEEGRFLLLEKLVADVLQICSRHPDITQSRVSIEKPHALRFADSVSLTMEYQADPAQQLPELEKAS